MDTIYPFFKKEKIPWKSVNWSEKITSCDYKLLLHSFSG